MTVEAVPRSLRALAGTVRLVVAAVILGGTAYVLSWQILHGGPAGNDIGFHLNLAEWVATTFPNLGWWYPWDDHGIPYRLGYPLAAHWLAVAAARAAGTGIPQGIQLVEFAITPLGAIGAYAFCAWRLHSPLAGLVAGFLYLLSPLAWTFLVDWGFYANQAGTVLFMPTLIALDAFFEEWQAGRRGWAFRVSALLTIGLTAVMAWISPFLLGASLAAVLAYALAARPGAGRPHLRWLLLVAPSLLAGTFLLTAFWSLPQQGYLALIGSRVPPRAYDPGLFNVWSFGQIFAWRPLDPNPLFDRTTLTPAAWLPALAGAVSAIRDRKARVLLALVAFGVLTMVTHALAALTWGLPVLPYLVHARGGVTLVQFGVPVLAGIGLVQVPAAIGAVAAARLRLGSGGRTGLAVVAVGAGLALGALGVGAFSHWVLGAPDKLAYGDYRPDFGDVWEYAAPGKAPPRPLWAQLVDLRDWRPPRVGCDLSSCRRGQAQLDRMGEAFPSPPQRAVVDAHVPQLLMNFHQLTGGAQAYTYNFQLPSSPELDNWVLDSMLARPGTTTKDQLAQVMGVDAVALGQTQASRANDYQQLGWHLAAASPMTFTNPAPSGLAAEWPGGATVLVIGRDQRSTSHPYNDVFEKATAGMIPYQEGWLVRGHSPYVDDYQPSELAQYQGLLLLGYRYHDRDAAWSRLEAYVRSGGRLYVESGWQYVDPDWNQATAPAVLPVGALSWGPLDPEAAAEVGGVAATGWGAFSFGGAGWGASSAAGARPGADALVTVGGRVVAARWRLGRGRVVWSGANLMAHATSTGSGAEDRFLADQWAWLLGSRPAADERTVAWSGDQRLGVSLDASPGPTWVLVKESMVPGWTAVLQTPAGDRQVVLRDAELDFILVRLDSVPAGSRLVLTYGPGAGVYLWWAISLAALVSLAAWTARPALFAPLVGLAPSARRRAAGISSRWGREDQ